VDASASSLHVRGCNLTCSCKHGWPDTDASFEGRQLQVMSVLNEC